MGSAKNDARGFSVKKDMASKPSKTAPKKKKQGLLLGLFDDLSYAAGEVLSPVPYFVFDALKKKKKGACSHLAAIVGE